MWKKLWQKVRRPWDITRQLLSFRSLLDLLGLWKPIVALVAALVSFFVARLENHSPLTSGLMGFGVLFMVLVILVLGSRLGKNTGTRAESNNHLISFEFLPDNPLNNGWHWRYPNPRPDDYFKKW